MPNASHRHHSLFIPRDPPTSTMDLSWNGADLVPNAELNVTIAPMSVAWTGAALTPAADTTVTIAPMDLSWIGAALTPISALPPDVPMDRWLIDVDTAGGVKRASQEDLEELPTFYEARLIDEPTLTSALREEEWGVIAYESFSFSVDASDGWIPASFTQTGRGRYVTFRRYDRQTGEILDRLAGIVDSASLSPEGLMTITGNTVGLAALQREVAAVKVEIGAYPRAVDLGATIPVVFGRVARVPMVYVNENIASNQYDYIVGHGTLGVTAAFRDGPNDTLYPIQFSECLNSSNQPATSWANARRTDLYSGYTALRFSVQQVNFSNGRHKLWADVDTISGFCGGIACPAGQERSFQRAIRVLLTNTTFGISQSVDATSFDSTEMLLAALTAGGLKCDGAITETVEAQVVLEQMLMARNMRLGTKAGTTQWTLAADALNSPIRLTTQTGPGDGQANVGRLGPLESPSNAEAISQVQLRYRRYALTGNHLLLASRTVQTVGRPLLLENDFVGDITTADMMADFISKRIASAQTRLRAELLRDARFLLVGDLVTLTYDMYSFTAQTLEVFALEEGLDSIWATLRTWASSAFTYTPGTLPSEPNIGTLEDLSNVSPLPAQGISKVSETVRQLADGTYVAETVMGFTVPSVNVAFAFLQHKTSLTGAWTPTGNVTAAGANQVTVSPQITFQDYWYSVVTVSPFGLATTSVTVGPFKTPRGTTAPATPSAPVATQVGRAVEITVSFTEPADWRATELYRSTSPTFVTQTLVESALKHVFHDQAVGLAYNTTYYYRARVVARSSATGGYLVGSYSAASNALFLAKIDAPSHIAPGTVTTPIIAPNAATYPTVAIANGGFNTSSFTPVQVPNISITITTTGEPVLIIISSVLVAQNSFAGQNIHIGGAVWLYRDGLQGPRTGNFTSNIVPGQSIETPLAVTLMDVPPPGTHTYTLRLSVHPSAGLGTVAVIGLAPGLGGAAASIVMEAVRFIR